MVRRGTTTGWLIAILLVLFGVTKGMAQPSAPDGAFVRAADGTVYAVSRGVQIRLAAAADNGQLAGLRQGPSVSTVDELNAAIAASAPPPVVSNPAETLIGQSTRICNGDVVFQVDVTGADWQRTILGRNATGSAMWVVVFMDMTNLGARDSAPYQFSAPSLRLVDERGRRFEGDIAGALFGFQSDLAASNGVKTFSEQLRPGITEPRVIGFEVAPDVQRLTAASVTPCP